MGFKILLGPRYWPNLYMRPQDQESEHTFILSIKIIDLFFFMHYLQKTGQNVRKNITETFTPGIIKTARQTEAVDNMIPTQCNYIQIYFFYFGAIKSQEMYI